MNRRSNIYRALVTNPGSAVYQDEQRVYARNLEVPSGGGVGTARGIAHAYGVFAAGGRRAGAAAGDAGPAGRARDSSDARVLRRMHEGRRRAVLAGLHEAERQSGRSAAPARSALREPAARSALRIRRPASGTRT